MDGGRTGKTGVRGLTYSTLGRMHHSPYVFTCTIHAVTPDTDKSPAGDSTRRHTAKGWTERPSYNSRALVERHRPRVLLYYLLLYLPSALSFGRQPRALSAVVGERATAHDPTNEKEGAEEAGQRSHLHAG